MVDVLLVNAPVKTRSKHARLNPPLGLAYIASVLLKNGYRVTAEDFNVTGLNPARAERMFEKGGPRILGISAHTETYLNGLKVAEIAKRSTRTPPWSWEGPMPLSCTGKWHARMTLTLSCGERAR